MQNELKPCPFCGGKAEFVTTITRVVNDEDFGYVRCMKKHCCEQGVNTTKSTATRRWNRRVGNAK